MKMTEEIQQAGLPSLLQIQYLMELEKIGWKRGAVMEIAEKCGVSHPAVSRYLKSCCEKGILNEKYEFTVSGKMMLERYRKLLGETEKYLTRIGIAQEEQKETLRKLIENLDCATLGRIVRSDRTPIQHTKGPLIWKEETFLDDMLEWGSWLERSIRTMNAMSRVDHAEMEGKLSSLKYECNGRLHKAEIRGNKVNIPLEACRFAQNSRGNHQRQSNDHQSAKLVADWSTAAWTGQASSGEDPDQPDKPDNPDQPGVLADGTYTIDGRIWHAAANQAFMISFRHCQMGMIRKSENWEIPSQAAKSRELVSREHFYTMHHSF